MEWNVATGLYDGVDIALKDAEFYLKIAVGVDHSS